MGCRRFFAASRLEVLVDEDDSRSSSRVHEHGCFLLVSQLHVVIQTLCSRDTTLTYSPSRCTTSYVIYDAFVVSKSLSSEASSNRERIRPLGRACPPPRRRHLDPLLWNCLVKNENNSWTLSSVEHLWLQWFHSSTSYPYLIFLRCTQCVVQSQIVLFMSSWKPCFNATHRSNSSDSDFTLASRCHVSFVFRVFDRVCRLLAFRCPTSRRLQWTCPKTVIAETTSISNILKKFQMTSSFDTRDRCQRRRSSSPLISNMRQNADTDMTWSVEYKQILDPHSFWNVQKPLKQRESDLIPIRSSFQNTSLLKNDDVQLDCRGTDVDMCPNFNGKLQIEH